MAKFHRRADKRLRVPRRVPLEERKKIIIPEHEHAVAKQTIESLKSRAGKLRGNQIHIFKFLGSEILGAKVFELKECAKRVNASKLPDSAKNVLHDLAVARYHELGGK